MKLSVIGGGGVRAPLFVASTLLRAEKIHLDELCLMDTNAEKLALIGELCQAVARWMGSPVKLTTTSDPRRALEGAAYIVTTVRVGAERGRILDERIALRHNLLGQETTGPGGFAMAMRSIPAILDYAALAEQVAPGAWIFNFTNPAGLVTQALRDSGFERTIGICDGANAAQHEAARFLDIPGDRLRAEVFGLNHLSWTRALWMDEPDHTAPPGAHGANGSLQNGGSPIDLFPELLYNRAFRAQSSQGMFDEALVDEIGMYINEYLYYYYYAEKAVASIQGEKLTRGEEVLELNQRLLEQLRTIDLQNNPEAALRAYYAYERRRGATYMHYARADAPSPEEADQSITTDMVPKPEEGEGYAGVALDIIQALESGIPRYTALNVPNLDAIPSMRPDDVVEVSCVVEQGQVRPLPIGEIPEPQELLMRSVKRYEQLAVESILTRSIRTAVMAMMAHPLVLSYSRAETLVDEYLEVHAPFVGDWK
jgi:6-phospho-beta-glucosidase